LKGRLEKAFSGELSAQEALDRACFEGNQLLENFEKDSLLPEK